MTDYKKYTPTFCRQTKILTAALQKNLKILAQNPRDRNVLQEILRQFHTLKGSAALMRCHNLEELAQSMEEVIKKTLDKHSKISPANIDKMISSCRTINRLADDFNQLTCISVK